MKGSLGRFVARAFPTPFPGFSVPGLARYPMYINKDRHNLAETLAAKLREKGIEAVVTDDMPATARHVIYIGAADEQAAADQLYAINFAAFAAARNVAASMEAHGGMFWTIQSTGGDFGLSGRSGNNAGTAGLAALAKTAMKEWPLAYVKAIDVDMNVDAEVIAGHICDELFHGGLEKEVGFTADGTRVAIGLRQADRRPSQAGILAPYDTLLVSGGARGVTAHSLIALARGRPLRYIVLGRSEPTEADSDIGTGGESEQELIKLLFERSLAEGRAEPPMELKKRAKTLIASREIRDTIRQLERLGSEAVYVPVNIADAKALSAAIAPWKEKWGPIRGVIHGAGILADKRIVDKRDEQFRQVFRTKVAGFRALLDAVDPDALKLIATFSSVAAREGNIGQCDYAMANEVLNKMACRLKNGRGSHVSFVVKSLNWGPWEGGMVTPELKRHFEAQGVSLIPLTAGAGFFAEEADGMNPEEVEIVVGGPAGSASAFFARQARTWTREKVLDPAACPWLDDHVIQDDRVVPVVMAHEWFVQFARSAYPDLDVERIENIKVLSGIRIPPDRTSPVTLIVTGTERHDAGPRFLVLDMELADAEGTKHYAARAVVGQDRTERSSRRETGESMFVREIGESMSELEAAAARASKRESGDRPPLAEWTLAPDRLYGGRLFHGPYFQVIQRLLCCSAEYAAGLLQARSEPRRVESFAPNGFPALLDGGLQLARLWGYECHAKPSLPMSIGRAVVPSRECPTEPVRCEVILQKQNQHKFVVDIAWFDQDGVCLALYEQVEMYFVPDRRKA